MRNTIEHRGYIGEVEVDFEDNCIYASVSNAKGLYLTAEGDTPVELRSAFRSLIDDYLAGAKDKGWVIVKLRALAIL